MTYEYAEYLKLLLLCGYSGELQAYMDDALVEQDPISDVVMALVTAGGNNKVMLSALNEYLQTNDAEIDYDKTVFDFVMAFLKRKYTEDSMSMDGITDLMMRIAVLTDRNLSNPWFTMYILSDFYCDVKAGYMDEEEYRRIFDSFLYDKVCYSYSTPIQPEESLFKRLIKRITGRH